MTSSKLTWLQLTTPWSHPKDFFCDSDLRGRQHPSLGRQRNALWKSHFQQDILSSPCIVFIAILRFLKTGDIFSQIIVNLIRPFYHCAGKKD